MCPQYHHHPLHHQNIRREEQGGDLQHQQGAFKWSEESGETAGGDRERSGQEEQHCVLGMMRLDTDRGLTFYCRTTELAAVSGVSGLATSTILTSSSAVHEMNIIISAHVYNLLFFS